MTSFLEVPISVQVQIAAPTVQPPDRLQKVSLIVDLPPGATLRGWSQPQWVSAVSASGERPTVTAVAYMAEDAATKTPRLHILGLSDGIFDLAGTVQVDLDLEVSSRRGGTDGELGPTLKVSGRGVGDAAGFGTWVLPSINPVEVAVSLESASVRKVESGLFRGKATRDESDDFVEVVSVGPSGSTRASTVVDIVPPYWKSRCEAEQPARLEPLGREHRCCYRPQANPGMRESCP